MFLEAENKCLDGNLTAPGAVLNGAAFMDDCMDMSGQFWRAVPEANGYFRLHTQLHHDRKCFEGNRYAPDAMLAGAAFMDSCQNVSGQLWKAVPEANGYFRLKTMFQGDNKCLEGNRFSPQAVLQGAAFMDDCRNVSGQLWKIVGGALNNGIPEAYAAGAAPQPVTLPPPQAPVVLPPPPAPVIHAAPPGANSAGGMPTVIVIQNQLTASPTIVLQPNDRVSINDFVNNRVYRYAAPSIDIQSINFDSGSSEIRFDQYGKVQMIADALMGILAANPGARFLIEGHTDAVGSDSSNFGLSQNRASELRNALIAVAGVPGGSLYTVGFGESDLLVPTQASEWLNRRVTLRRIDQFVR